MSEFNREDELINVVGGEYSTLRDLLTVFEEEIEKIKNKFDSTKPIDLKNYQDIEAYLVALITQAGKILDLIKTFGTQDKYDFISFLRKKIDLAIEDLSKDRRVIVENGGDPVPVKALLLPQFLEERLRLYANVEEDKRKGTTDYAARREEYRALKILPAGRSIPGFRTDLKNLAAKYPGIEDTKSPLAEEAMLSTDEDRLETFFLAELLREKYNNEIDTTWLREVPGDPTIGGKTGQPPVEHPNILVRFLSLTQIYEGNSPKKLKNLGHLALLKDALQTILDDTDVLRERKESLPSTNDKAVLERYNVTEQRINELIDVINLILDIKKSPQFTQWQEKVLKNVVVYGTAPTGEAYQAFLNRVDAKLRTGTALTVDERKDLEVIQTHLSTQRDHIARFPYIDVNNSGFNQRLNQEQQKVADEELQMVQTLLDSDSQISGASHVEKANINETRADNLRIVQAVYDKLARSNPELPPFIELRPEHLHTVMRELTVSIINYMMETTMEKTVNAGGGIYGLPNASADLWENFKFAAVSDSESSDTLKFFFDEFPWDRLMPDLTLETKKFWLDMWKNRFLHMQCLHSYATIFGSRKDKYQAPNTKFDIRNDINAKGDGGGMMRWDMPDFHRRQYEIALDMKPSVQQEMLKFFPEGEDYWRVPELVNYFIRGLKLALPNDRLPMTTVAVDESKTEAEITRNLLISQLPDAYRIKDADGNYKDDKIIGLAWLVAVWKLHATLEIFDFDDDGLDTNGAAEVYNNKQYLVKVMTGMANTGKVWRDGIEQLERVWPLRSEFVYMYVKLSPEMYTTYTLEELIAENKGYKTKLKSGTLKGQEKRKIEQRSRHLSLFIREAKQASLGEYQDFYNLSVLTKLKEKLDTMPRLSKLDNYQAENFQTLYDVYMTTINKYAATSKDVAEFRDSLTGTKPKLSDDRLKAIHAKHKGMIDELRKAGHNLAVNQRYVLMRIKPEYAALSEVHGQQEDLNVLRVPIAHFEDSQVEALEKNKPELKHYIALSDRQITDSLINPAYVRYDTVTINHTLKWGGATNDLEWFVRCLTLRSPGAVFPEIHGTPFYKHNIKAQIEHKETKFFRQLNMSLKDLGLFLAKNPHYAEEHAEELDEYLRENTVHIDQLTIDDLVKDPLKDEKDGGGNGMAFSRVTQGTGRYATDKMTSVGPSFSEQTGMRISEMLVNIFRKPFFDEQGSLRELRMRSSGPKDIRAAFQTATREYIRLAADIMNFRDENGKTMHQSALNQMVVEIFMITVGMYLDQYRYKSIENGHSVHVTSGQLKHVRGEIGTVSGADPLAFPERELFLQMCDMMLESFLDKDFGGEFAANDPKASAEKKVQRIYTRKHIEDMMHERGIVGSAEQFVVDMVYYKGDEWQGKIKNAIAESHKTADSAKH